MAEPLLRRTFSRLRGRDRPRGKKADKERDPPPPSPDPPADPDPAASRRQNWSRFSCGGHDQERRSPPASKASLDPVDPKEAADPQASIQPPSEEDLELVEAAEEPKGSVELGAAGRCPSHGVYLRSLERSSRHWVLSSAKGPGLDELGGAAEAAAAAGTGGGTGSEGDIWYNPIPEDEDSQVGSSWKDGPKVAAPGDVEVLGGLAPSKATKEEAARGGLGTAESCGHRGGTVMAGTVPPSRGEEPAAGRSQACGKVPIPCVTSGLSSASSSPPGSPRRGSALQKVKSPGTVRRLSMKMRKLPELRRKLSLRSPRAPRAQEGGTAGAEAGKESSNVISRYHLDTSVASAPGPPRGRVVVSRGGYLSDGDSPQLPAKAGGAPADNEEEEEDGEKALEVALYQPYSSEEPAERGGQRISGLVSVHLQGLKDLKPPKVEAREVFCVLQVDSVNRARTALLASKKAFLALNHTFNLELEGARQLKVVVFSWDPTSCRNRICCHGTVVLPQIFRGCRAQQLAVQLQPRGVLYSKLSLVEQWDNPSEGEPRVFGVELGQLVEREKTTTKVPLIIQKCVAEIEKRGLKVVGLYRLCGSAAVKKELREAFERDSSAVSLCQRRYPDINVITGILKDFLRELPTPLITPTLYQVVLEAMARRAPRTSWGHRDAVSLLDCLPQVQKATLKLLLDHLSLVASFHPFNRMTPQNIAVCFGPVLLTHHQELQGSAATKATTMATTMATTTATSSPTEDISGAVDFKRHIEVLHYLLQAWPAPSSSPVLPLGSGPPPSVPPPPARGPPLQLELLERLPVVARPRPRGPESPPSNRYAGDWSHNQLPAAAGHGQQGAAEGQQGAAGDLQGAAGDQQRAAGGKQGAAGDHQQPAGDLQGAAGDQQGAAGDLQGAAGDLQGPARRTLGVALLGLGQEGSNGLGAKLSLKDFDALISDLERELAKQINVCL